MLQFLNICVFQGENRKYPSVDFLVAEEIGKIPDNDEFTEVTVLKRLHTGKDFFLLSVKKLLKDFKKSMKNISVQMKKDNLSSSAKHILRDNYHLINRICLDCQLSLAHVKTLPAVNQDMPRIYEYALDYCRLNNCAIREPLEAYLKKVGEEIELQNDEINLFPTIFQVVLVKELSEMLNEKQRNISVLVSSLQYLSSYTVKDLHALVSKNETLLLRDPDYARMDKESKNLYRYKISEKAKKIGVSEREIITAAFEKAKNSTGQKKHFGFYLFERRPSAYIPLTILIPITAFFCVFLFFGNIWFALLFLFPFWEIWKISVDFFYSRLKKPLPVPRMDTERFCPKSLVTITTFIPDSQAVDALCEKLTEYSYSNACKGLFFGILADFPAAETPETKEDKALCEYLKKKIDGLNFRLENRFFAAVRKRSFSEEEKKYTGNERKRGAVADFLHAVETCDSSGFMTICGDPFQAKYFVCLDEDTRPDIDSVKKLVGVLEHPLAAPVFNPEGTAVVKGYGIAAPRIDVSLNSAEKNMFTRIISGLGGVEMYGTPFFSIYQDLFGEGIFSGKGAIHIAAFNTVIKGLFPKGKVLSHDILEGSFLNCVFASDLSFFDSVPESILTYTKRNHRWIRGDWQNIRYLFRTIKTENGEKIKNPLSAVSKYKIFDNIRRPLTPVFILLCLLFGGLFSPFLFILGLLASFLPCVFEFLSLLLKPVRAKSIHYHSGIYTAVERSLLQTFVNFLFLPYITFENADAVVKAIYRSFHGKKLMEWVTAGQSEKRNRGRLISYIKGLWPQWLAVCFLFFPLLFLPSLFWISAPFIGYFLSKPEVRKKYSLNVGQITEDLSGMWRYFSDFLNEKNNFLPPDNYQEEPLGIEARRTSPTNIGLAMLSCLGAYDIGFIDEERLFFLIGKTLDTIEKLEKWNGHLLNWYSTETLQPLRPAFVSTVDNGNFIAMLSALKNGLSAMENESAERLSCRLAKILSTTDFSLLYDERKDLFFIGYDCEKKAYAEGHYDLYAGEALTTSYYSVAKRQVPYRHWQKLAKYTVSRGGCFYVKSWTGTMFEYFMPKILLPNYGGSFSDEMLRGVVKQQMKRNKKEVWGNSESAYYSFDPALNYQYKAFGVQELALKRGMNEENVISPYSSWLALPFFPRLAEKNLQLLREMGMTGKYGFFDAVDKTPSRTGGSPAIIHNYMAHHVGMSFLSGINALFNGVMQTRFMDEEMEAFSALLQEKLPSSTVDYEGGIAVSGQKHYCHSHYEEIFEINPEFPKVRILSNGGHTSIMSDSGIGYIKNADLNLTRFRESNEEPKGIFAFVKNGDRIMSLTKAPLYDKGTSYKTYFEEGGVTYSSRQREMEALYSVTVSTKYDCEARQIKIKNNSYKPKEFTLMLYFEPILASSFSETAHPAFSGLFVTGKWEEEQKALVFGRRRRDSSEKEFFAALCCVDFDGKPVSFEYELSRFRILTHMEGVKSIANAFAVPFSGKETPVDPCCAVRFSFSVKPREVRTFTFFLSTASSEQRALNNLAKTKKYSFGQIWDSCQQKQRSLYRDNFFQKEDVILCEILSSSIFMPGKSRFPFPKFTNRLGIERLWYYGISGDYPLILIKTTERTKEKVQSFLKAFSLLKMNHIDCELAVCFSDGGNYERPVYSCIREYIRYIGLEKYFNQRNGVFLCNIETIEDFSLLGSVSAFYADLEKGWTAESRCSVFEIRSEKQGLPEPLHYLYKSGMGGFIRDELYGAGFGIDDKKLFPNRPPWCHILANQGFGSVVSDSSLGFTFGKNASQNKITPWSNDVVTDNTGEKLLLFLKNEVYDVIKRATAEFYQGVAVYTCNIGDIEVKTTVFVPLYLPVKILSVSIDNPTDTPVSLRFCTNIILTDRVIRKVTRTMENGVAYYHNPMNTFLPGGVAFVFCDSGSISSGEAVFTAPSGEKTEGSFYLGYGVCRKQAGDLVQLLQEDGRAKKELDKVVAYFQKENRILIKTEDVSLNLFYNTFLVYQSVYARMTAKTGFYQCSGAVGFRDQLQDALCLSSVDIHYLKKQLVKAAAHQFEEGDVLHWWHRRVDKNSAVKGSRTRSSDDLLWLPYALAEYYERSGDAEFLNKCIGYIKGPLLEEGESERYVEVRQSEASDSLYLHSVKALKRGIRLGDKNLLLIGSGDWNDGLTNVGVKGKGQTVWGSMFAVMVMEKFLILTSFFQDSETEAFCREHIALLRSGIEDNAWDGEWYLRGYFDSGKPFGAKGNTECEIDLLPQAFASVVGGFDPYRRRRALDRAEERLVDPENGIIKLLDPPYENSEESPGYIQGYIAGIRENGGQYTHGALWYVWGLFCDGQYDKAYRMLSMINPVNKTETLEDVKKYRVEPYVLSGDVYSNPDVAGMGGWSHYTGSAGWFFRIVTEELLGIRIRQGKLFLDPKLPRDWKEYRAEIRIEGAEILLEVRKSLSKSLTVDGKEAETIVLDGKNHTILYEYIPL